MTSAQPSAQDQVSRLRAAVGQAVAVGHDFMRGGTDAHAMAQAMTQTVADYVEQERAAGRDLKPVGTEAIRLTEALSELKNCGSGYLAGRCDAA